MSPAADRADADPPALRRRAPGCSRIRLPRGLQDRRRGANPSAPSTAQPSPIFRRSAERRVANALPGHWGRRAGPAPRSRWSPAPVRRRRTPPSCRASRMAATLTATNSPGARSGTAWIAPTGISMPLPVPPAIATSGWLRAAARVSRPGAGWVDIVDAETGPRLADGVGGAIAVLAPDPLMVPDCRTILWPWRKTSPMVRRGVGLWLATAGARDAAGRGRCGPCRPGRTGGIGCFVTERPAACEDPAAPAVRTGWR